MKKNYLMLFSTFIIKVLYYTSLIKLWRTSTSLTLSGFVKWWPVWSGYLQLGKSPLWRMVCRTTITLYPIGNPVRATAIGYLFQELRISWIKQKSLWKLFSWTLVIHTHTHYNTPKLAHATHRATHRDIMAEKLTEERYCVDSAVRRFSYLQRCMKSSDCLVLCTQTNLCACHLSMSWLLGDQ